MVDTRRKTYKLLRGSNSDIDHAAKRLRNTAGGKTYEIIYLKLILLSSDSDGRLSFDDDEDIYEVLATKIDETPEDIMLAMLYMKELGFLEVSYDTEE